MPSPKYSVEEKVIGFFATAPMEDAQRVLASCRAIVDMRRPVAKAKTHPAHRVTTRVELPVEPKVTGSER